MVIGAASSGLGMGGDARVPLALVDLSTGLEVIPGVPGSFHDHEPPTHFMWSFLLDYHNYLPFWKIPSLWNLL
jgi:hypothetical protein